MNNFIFDNDLNNKIKTIILAFSERLFILKKINQIVDFKFSLEAAYLDAYKDFKQGKYNKVNTEHDDCIRIIEEDELNIS